jgi:hypothetical protein
MTIGYRPIAVNKAVISHAQFTTAHLTHELYEL